MVTTIYILLLAGFILLPALLLYRYDKKQKRQDQQRLFQQFTQSGLARHLSFSSQERLGSTVFGVDLGNRKMLVMEKLPDGDYATTLIDLDEVKGCAIRKEYATASGSSFGTRVTASKPSFISLSIFQNEKPPFNLVFYSGEDSGVGNAALLEEKARQWEQILSKLVTSAGRRA